MKKEVSLATVVPEELANQRLDILLASLFPEYSRARLQAWIREGFVKADGKTVLSTKGKIAAGTALTVEASLADQIAWSPQVSELQPIYVDEHIMIINKPAGLVVHPAAGNREGTLVNALLYQFPELAQLPRAGIVHRLDKDTTGVMVVARSLIAHAALVEQLQARTMRREYQAIVRGALISGGNVEANVGRHPSQRTKMAVVQGGKFAKTYYWVEERFKAYTLLRLKLESGRTHQIRVHMAHIGYPLVGDPVYGGRFTLPKGLTAETAEKIKAFRRQALHAQRLSLAHPASGENMTWESPMPDDMQNLLKVLRNEE